MEYSSIHATEDQLDQICAIWEAGWHEAHAAIVPGNLAQLRTHESFLERAAELIENTFVASDGTAVLGFYMVKDDELYQMYVAPKARGVGLAQALISDAEKRIRAQGHTSAWLACAVGNDRAGRFYEKAGWMNSGATVVELDTSSGAFPLEVWRFVKDLNTS